MYAAKALVSDCIETGPGSDFRRAFESLKAELVAKPALFHFQPDRELYDFVDASKERGIGAAAYQLSSPTMPYTKTELRPILFLSGVLTPAETRYWPMELEFSGLVWTVKKLTNYIEQTHTTLITDHKPSVDIASMRGLATTSTARANFRLQTWANDLSQYADRVTLTYTKGKDREVPDALSRMRAEVSSTRGATLTKAEALRPGGPMEDFQVDPALYGESDSDIQGYNGEQSPEEHGEVAHMSLEFMDRVISGYAQNAHVRAQVTWLKDTGSPKEEEPDILMEPGGPFVLVSHRPGNRRHIRRLLYFEDPSTGVKLLVVPTMELQRELLMLGHDKEGHQGLLRTYKKLAAVCYWRGMVPAVKQYIAHCRACQRNRTWTHRPYAQLRPIVSPGGPFHTMAIDLVTDLPEDEGKDAIMTVTDRFTKAVRFIPGRKDDSEVDWAHLFQLHVVHGGWGYPKVLISDRDPRFLSTFWKTMLQMAGTRSITTTAYHPAGDGQSERTNQTLEVALRYYVDNAQSGWLRRLPFLESELNNSESFTTGRAPNEILYGIKTGTALDLSGADRPLEEEIAETREAIRLEAEGAIKVVQARMARAYDKKHMKPDFSSGYAFISLRSGYGLPSTVKTKLAAQQMGPFRIIRRVGRRAAFELELPEHYRIHPVVSVVHLEPALQQESDPFRRESPPHESIVNEAGDHVWEVEELLKRREVGRRGRRRVEYLVCWKSWREEYEQWIDEREIAEKPGRAGA